MPVLAGFAGVGGQPVAVEGERRWEAEPLCSLLPPHPSQPPSLRG